MDRTRPLAMALAAILVACGGALHSPDAAEPTVAVPGLVGSPAAAPTPTVAPTRAASPTPATEAAPVSAGAVADAGVLLLRGADGAIHRYDGETGALERIAEQVTLWRETDTGVHMAGRDGAAELIGWDGTTTSVAEQPPRPAVPSDWTVVSTVPSPDGQRLLFIRVIAQRPGPGMDPGLSALYVQERDGRVRELYRPPERGILRTPVWSPDGTKALVTQVETTSNSFAADGVGITTILVDLAQGTTRSLGTVMNSTWATWAPDGRLAFVRGGGRGTWWNKALFVLERDRAEHLVGSADGRTRVGIAPAWGPSGQLGWVSGPAEDTLSGIEYVAGTGVGDRVAVVDGAGDRREVACADGRVVEGLRWSGDGTKLLLLCRVPGKDPLPLELWLYRLNDDTSAPLVRGLRSGIPGAGGFGYYGMQPPITSVAAWSLGFRLP